MTAAALPRRAVEAELGEPVAHAHAVGGGSINDAWRIELGSGRPLFLKSRPGVSPAEFAAEAAGLSWLEQGGARVPAVLAAGKEEPFLALEWVEPGSLSASGGEDLGRALAELHRAGAPRYGSLPPVAPDTTLRLGSVHLELAEGESWPAVYAEHLVLPLARRARERGALDAAGARAVESACDRLDELAGPTEPPARLHGDLWSGNVLADTDGKGWLIDPAAYGGHREVDLAMLRLFGAPSDRILAAYDEAFPLAAGHSERVGLWQLLPLLVHAILFGGAYGASAARAAAAFS